MKRLRTFLIFVAMVIAAAVGRAFVGAFSDEGAKRHTREMNRLYPVPPPVVIDPNRR